MPALSWAVVEHPVGRIGRVMGETGWTTSYPHLHSQRHPPCRRCNQCIVSGCWCRAHQSVSQAAASPAQSKSVPCFDGDPLTQTRLLLCPLRSVVPFPRLGPRDSTGDETHRPGRSNSARFPGAGHAGRTRRKRSSTTYSSCWPATTRPGRGATEIDHPRHLMPARQPGKQALAWPKFHRGGPGFAHIRRPFSRQDERRD